MRKFVIFLAAFVGLSFSPLQAQAPQPKLQIFVDTAGVAAAQTPGVYVTWIFAKAGPQTFPSSGILVAFDCNKQMVKRLAHVVYKINADSSTVSGPVIEDDQSWVAPTIPTLFNLVCSTGAAHARKNTMAEPTQPPAVKPQSPYFKA